MMEQTCDEYLGCLDCYGCDDDPERNACSNCDREFRP